MATQHSTSRARKFQDLTGQKFGKWTVLKLHSIGNGKATRWMCRCGCGLEKSVLAYLLKNGGSKSCIRCSNTTHDKTLTPEYFSWKAMHSRCRNKKSPCYANYGGRGISICLRWMKFETFLADMGHRPSPQHSLDRINNDGDYEPDNCRWATPKEQRRNTRINRMLTYDETTLCMSEWAETCNISRELLHYRLTHGWSVKQALTTRPGTKRTKD